MTRERPHDDEQRGRHALTPSRRRFLAATGVAGIAGATGVAFAQQGATTYEFGARVAGWQGQAPSAIEGETNPTLQLEAGTEYEVVWENLDGMPHDFVIYDGEGNELVGTDIVSEEGATTTLSFTASEEMVEYICTVHPNTMVGDIEIGTGAGTPTPTETETPAPQQTFVPEGPTVGATLVADGPLVNPVNLRTVPGEDDTHLVVDQAGSIYVLAGGELREEPFLDVSGAIAFLDGREGGFDERGLLGMDFHPNYQENGLVYIRYSSVEPVSEGAGLVGPGDRELPEDWDHVEVLSEFEVADDDGQVSADPDSERVLLEVPEPQFNHNGGEVTFGPDGLLYTSLGDGGGANDVGMGHVADWYEANEGGNGQDVTDNLLGSILRLNVDEDGEDTPYAVPDDNPLVGTEGMDEIYAWGLRNPWRMSFNDGTLITADVGQSLFEEVDVVESGGNYGWNVKEGSYCFNAADATTLLDQCPSSAPDESPFDGQPLVDPVLEYPHNYEGSPVGISITGGYTHLGDQVSELSDLYVFGDWSTNFAMANGRVFAATVPAEDGETATPQSGTEVAETGTPMETPTATETATVTPGDGNETATGTATDTPEPVEQQVEIPLPDEQQWPFVEVLFEGSENQRLNRFVQAFGRDDAGSIYVLASRTGRLTSDAGEVWQIVPAGEGDEITQPEPATPTDDGGEDEDGDDGNGAGNGDGEDEGRVVFP